MGDPSAKRPAPSAHGTLAKTPLVHLLLYALEKKLGGTLELIGPDGSTAAVLFVAGEPAKVRTSEPAAHLGRVLLELGFLRDDQLNRSLAELAKQKAEGRRLHGELLLEQRLIDQRALQAGLREQIARKLQHVAGMSGDSAYEYYDGFDALCTWGGDAPAGADPLPMLWGILRAHPPTDHVAATLSRVGANPIRLAGKTQLARLGLGKDDLAALEPLRARPLEASVVAHAPGMSERTGRLLVYLLLITKQVEVVAASRPPSRSVPASPPPPSPAAVRRGSAEPPPGASPPSSASDDAAPKSVPRELQARWKEIEDRAANIEQEDYFAVLGVQQGATTAQIQAAFLELAKRWHPDRLPRELAAVRPACSRVFARMSEAHSTLSNPDDRARYEQLRAAGGGAMREEDVVERAMDALTLFQKAEVCFRRNDLAQAETYCRQAIELDETQADYLALAAWIEAVKPESQSLQGAADVLSECLQMLDRAVSKNGQCERAYFYRAMIRKRVGDSDGAMEDFRQAIELNPHNIDAARELRLHNMRGGQTPKRHDMPAPRKSGTGPKKTPSGLFEKLFKKP